MSDIITTNHIGRGIATAGIWAAGAVVAVYCKDYNFGWATLATLLIWATYKKGESVWDGKLDYRKIRNPSL